MTPAELFRTVIAILEDAGIPHMLTGSFASAYHGAPRATQDIDLVIEANTDQVEALVRLLPPSDWYVDKDAALEAVRTEGQFNIIDRQWGWKIDLIVRKSRPFSEAEFRRRQTAELEGARIDVVTAEDLIVAKLEWAKAGGSRRQVEDVASILRMRSGELDLAMVEGWVRAFGLEHEWLEAQALNSQ